MNMDQPLIIRQAQESDAKALSELAIKTYVDAYGHSFSDSDLAWHLEKHLSPSNFARTISEDIVLLAEIGGRIIGYVQFGAANTFSDRKEDRELRRLYVHPEFQNQGYGGSLMDAALRHPRMNDAESIYLDVWEQNPAAQRFYQRYGFEIVGTRRFEVKSGASTSLDLIMVRLAREFPLEG
jgi:ribosomal protein S18 acetylase RimI-like enzyme